MSKNKIKDILKYTLLIFLMNMFSCIEEIDMKTYNHNSKIVINSLFSPDSNFYVTVSKSTAIQDANYPIGAFPEDSIPYTERWYIDPVKVENPIVEIWKNGEFTEELVPVGTGIFRSINETPLTGIEYEIKVSAPGLKSVYANDKIPDKVKISNISYDDVGYAFDNENYFTKVTVEFTDPIKQENYYEIMSPDPSYYLCDNIGGGSSFSVGYMEILSDDALILAEGDQDIECASLVFSDKLINGQTYKLNIYLKGFLENCDTYTEFEFKVELRSISHEYYLYRKKMRKYLNYNDKNVSNLERIYSIGEPVLMYTNVENGYGVFVGYSADTVRVIYP